jgi:hypothetical protein
MGPFSPGRVQAAGAAMPDSVAGRYRLEQHLATGGIGEVYRAVDESTGNRIALKRLLKQYVKVHRVWMLFEREYYTLAQLKHPRIIEVFDYGVDAEGPYYTMELLEGRDLRELMPAPFRRACSYLRDIASSLALLHTRRLLHRDVSPRNVRCDAQGRCKLLDFGTMASFGVSGEVVGTPPYIPPETLHGLPLDHRSDLYALGALAYRILTQKHAYPARRLDDLPKVWKSPPARPSAGVPEIPPALDELVMSLLNHDPLARPSSAAEVIERLNNIADLEPEEATETVRSYLLSSAMVGRDRNVEHLRDRLIKAKQGRGSSIAIEGPAGMGKTRLLSEVSLQAQLVGATVVRVEAGVNRTTYGVARALARALLKAAPKEALHAAQPYAPVLGQLFPELDLGTTHLAPLPEDRAERRARIQSALLSWFIQYASSRVLVVQVDDLHRADESSVSFLAALAHEAPAYPLLVVATLRRGEGVSAREAVRTFMSAAGRVRLQRLRESETLKLVQSLFGDVPNADRLAKWMRELSGGNPLQCIDLAHHLVDSGIVRYLEGIWVLPAELSLSALPGSLAEAMDARVASLNPQARALAETLSVHRGALSLELSLAAAEEKDVGRAYAVLGELVAAGVLVSSGDGYRFGQEALREAFLRGLIPERRRALHRSLGEAMLGAGRDKAEDAIEAGWHLLQGGELSRGADLLARSARGLAIQGDALAAAIPAMEAALRVYEKQGRSPAEILRLRSLLVSLGWFVDRTLADRYGEETIQSLYYFSGMAAAARLKPWLGGRLALIAGMAGAMLRRAFSSGKRRGPRVGKALIYFIRCVTSLIGVRTIMVDARNVVILARLVDPLTGFGPKHSGQAIHRFCKCLALYMLGRESESDKFAGQAIALLRDPTACREMEPETRQALLTGMWLQRGLNECVADDSSALQVAGEIERVGAKIGDAAAHQIRMIYHLVRGEVEQAREHREKLEMHAMQGGTTWQVELFSAIHEGLLNGFHRDIVGVKRTVENLLRLTKDIPSLVPHLQMTKAFQLYHRGEYREGGEIADQLIGYMKPRQYMLWQFPYVIRAMICNRLGEHDRAKQLCQQAFGQVPPADRRYTSLYFHLERVLALAEAGEGDTGSAMRSLDELIGSLARYGNPATMFMLHEARARVALMAGDQQAFEQDVKQMRRWAQATGNPAFLSHCERFAEQGARTGERIEVAPVLDEGEEVATVISAPRADEIVRNVMQECQELHERAQRALHMIIEQARGTGGFLFLVEPGGLMLASRVGARRPPDGLPERVADFIERGGVEDEDSTPSEMQLTTETTYGDPSTEAGRSKGAFRLLALTGWRSGKQVPIGAVALTMTEEPLKQVQPELIQAIAAYL